MRKGVFIPDITVDMFKNASLEGVEEFMTSGQMEDIEIPSWIPITYRPMDEEEYEEYRKEFGEIPIEHRKMFSCPMPEDDQEILICTSWRGVSLDRCEIDEYGYALEEHGDWDGVMAWMPLPKPYEAESEK